MLSLDIIRKPFPPDYAKRKKKVASSFSKYNFASEWIWGTETSLYISLVSKYNDFHLIPDEVYIQCSDCCVHFVTSLGMERGLLRLVNSYLCVNPYLEV